MMNIHIIFVKSKTFYNEYLNGGNCLDEILNNENNVPKLVH